MNFGEKESFQFKHRYFFIQLSCKFIGLTLETKNKFEALIVNLKGTISEEAEYIFTDELFFKNNASRNDLYSTGYLLDSIKHKKLLDITNYRFSKQTSEDTSNDHKTNCCCVMGKYVFHKSCEKYYLENVYCADCYDKIPDNSSQEITSDSVSISSNHTENWDEENAINRDDSIIDNQHISSNKSSQSEKIIKNNLKIGHNNVSKKHKLSEEKAKSTISKWYKKKRIHENNPNSNNNQTIALNAGSNVELIPKKGEKERSNLEKDIMEVDLLSDDEYKEKSTESKKNSSNILIIEIDSDSDKNICSDTNRSTPQFKSLKPPQTENFKRSSTSKDNVPENRIKKLKPNHSFIKSSLFYKNEWNWDILPEPNDEPDENYKEPPVNKNGESRSARLPFSKNEKRIMLTYLYIKDLIDEGVHLSTWRRFHQDGYLRHRPLESLRNNFRKHLLRNLKILNVPEEIEEYLQNLYPKYCEGSEQ